jgi:hypothetical protein
MATFLGQSVRPICKLVISFYGTTWKEECFRQVRPNYMISNYEFMNKGMPCQLSCPRSGKCFFFVVKGPAADARTHRSLEAYCATLWWRWLIFSIFQVMEHRWNETDRGKPKYSGEKPVPVPLCPPQILHGLTRDRTRASAVRGRRLTAWAMERLSGKCYEPSSSTHQSWWMISDGRCS